MKRFLILGSGVWLGATVLLRLSSSQLLRPGRTAAILVLFAASFALMFLLLRLAVRGMNSAAALRAGIALLVPTLILDAFASAFFSSAYPNFSPAAAGLFGGWMLICSAGGLVAVMTAR